MNILRDSTGYVGSAFAARLSKLDLLHRGVSRRDVDYTYRETLVRLIADTGTKDSLLDVCNFVAPVEKRQGLKIARVEEIAYAQHFVDARQLKALIANNSNDYGDYLRYLANESAPAGKHEVVAS